MIQSEHFPLTFAHYNIGSQSSSSEELLGGLLKPIMHLSQASLHSLIGQLQGQGCEVAFPVGFQVLLSQWWPHCPARYSSLPFLLSCLILLPVQPAHPLPLSKHRSSHLLWAKHMAGVAESQGQTLQEPERRKCRAGISQQHSGMIRHAPFSVFPSTMTLNLRGNS